MPASGPVQESKMFPAATMEDQEKMANEENNPIVLGGVPFSSPDPATEARKMLPLEDGTSAYEAREPSESASGDYDSMKVADLKKLAEERDLKVEGGRKADLLDALRGDDAKDMKAADFKAKIDAATTQEELDEVAELYSASGADYSSVDDALDKKQNEINDGS